MARKMICVFSSVERSGVGVFDAQDEFAAHGAGERPVVDGGAGAADVKLASGRRREANAYGVSWSSEYSS